MSSSFIAFNNKGHWIPDGYNELIARYLVQCVDDASYKPGWLLAMRERFIEIAQGYFNGWNNFGFDDYLNDDPDNIKYFKQILDDSIDLLHRVGPTISKDELNSFIVPQHLKSNWTKDVETSELIELIEKIKAIFPNQELNT